MIARVAAAAAAALLLVACGDDTESRYRAQVADVRAAVEAGDRDAALASLEEVGMSAFAAHAEGDVSDEELAELAVLLDRARAQIAEELPEPAATTTSSTAPPTTAPAPVAQADDGDDDDEDRGRGNGRGRGGDDGDDDDDD